MEAVILALIGAIEVVFLTRLEEVNKKLDKLNEKVELIEDKQLRMFRNVHKRADDL